MSTGELKGILLAKVTNSLGYYGGKLSKTRVTALQYYQGELFGNEMDGRSQVVDRVVAEAIDGMMPALMKIFTSGEETVRFEPTAKDVPQGTPPAQVMLQLKRVEQQAKQATDYVNWIWSQQNKGFENTFIWFKDAMLNRAAAIKIWWDDAVTVKREKYEGLSDAEFALLLQDTTADDLEIISHEAYPDPDAPAAIPSAPALAGAGGAPIMGGVSPPSLPMEPPAPPMLHDVELRVTNKTGRIRILPIPGEEFLMDRRAVSLEDTPFVAHRAKKVLSDLLEMGYDWDLIRTLGEGDSSDFNLERLERFRQEDELPYRTGNNYDPSMREVWINECYLKVDFDGDGVAELRKVIFAGESGNFAPGSTVILENEEVDDHPFAAITPVPMPHKFYGQSIADKTMDLQLIKSTIFRSFLDHIYNAIMPQLAVNTSLVNLDDLLTRRTGGVVRTQGNPGEAIWPVPQGQLGADPIEILSYLDTVREGRTGVQKFTASPGPNALNNAYTDTATGANILENASQEQIELVARCYAEIGMKPAFRKILKLVTTHQNKPKIVKLKGTLTVINPREWDDEFDMTVTVGLGTGNRQQQMQAIGMILQVQNQLIQLQKGVQGPLVTAENVYNTLDKACLFFGLHGATGFFTDPATSPMPPQQQQQVDPHIQAAQIKAQADQQTAQLQLQHDAQKSQLQMQADAVKAQHDVAIQREKMAMEGQLAREKMQAEMQRDIEIARFKIAAQREVDFARIAAQRQEFDAESQMRVHEHEGDMSMRREELSANTAIAKHKAKVEKPEARS